MRRRKPDSAQYFRNNPQNNSNLYLLLGIMFIINSSLKVLELEGFCQKQLEEFVLVKDLVSSGFPFLAVVDLF